MNQTPTLETVIRRALDARLRGVRVGLPGRIESYNDATGAADVQPLIYDGYADETGARHAQRPPVVTGVPVLHAGGGGGDRLTFPVAVGDVVWLMFASSSLDRWLALGGEVDPGSDHHHHLSDAVAITGLSDFAHARATHATATVLESADLRLGGADGASPVATKATLHGFRAALTTAIGTLGSDPSALAALVALRTALVDADWPDAFVAEKVSAL